MIGRTPGNIVAIRPLKEGVIANYTITQKMLEYVVNKVAGKSFFSKPRIMVCIPTGVTSVEKRAVLEAAMQAGASKTYLIEEPLAAALGAGLDIAAAAGSMVVDIGGGTADIAVVTMGSISISKSVKIAGNILDEDIIRYLRRERNIVIGEKTAESIKKRIGCAYLRDTELAIGIKGKFIRSAGGKQQVEVIAGDIEVYGIADPQEYPYRKGTFLEYLREIAHLRLRTNTFGAIFRIRHNMAFAIHRYFNERGFFYFNTPIITTSDSEGAGELFEVKTELKDDFFGSPANLTVSGQLEGELGALALGAIYTFSPTFRAENSNTFRHLSEFWMIEPEVAFNDINDNMDLAENFLKYLIRYALENCESDLAFLNDNVDNGLMDKLHFVANNEFMRLPYSKAIEILQESGRQFDYPVKPGLIYVLNMNVIW